MSGSSTEIITLIHVRYHTIARSYIGLWFGGATPLLLWLSAVLIHPCPHIHRRAHANTTNAAEATCDPPTPVRDSR